MRMLVVAAVVACMSGAAFAAELSKSSQTAEVKQWESARCWVCQGGGNNGGTNGGNGAK